MNRIVSFRQFAALAILAPSVLLNTGCATNGRSLLLKEYGASGPLALPRPLDGTTICLGAFTCANNLTAPTPASKPEEPADFKFVNFTSEQDKMWGQEMKALQKKTVKGDRREIGSLRNMLGMELSHVYALNDPGLWIADSLRLDLEAQGAKVVDASQAESADLVISGTVQFCRVDIYMKIWGDMVIDLSLKPKNGAAIQKTFHTAGGTTAWVGSEGEFYKPLRECRQKQSWLISREIAASCKPGK